MALMNASGKVLRSGTRQPCLLIQHVQETVGALFEEVDAVLVVRVLYALHVQSLLLVELLLLLQDAVVEELLELLVAVVDAELLEGVDREEL